MLYLNTAIVSQPFFFKSRIDLFLHWNIFFHQVIYTLKAAVTTAAEGNNIKAFFLGQR